ncbi:phosphatidylinositol-binding protein scs2 [Coemansia sp. RSA 552]|nr:phosphatidylinositol-binding protein scs2 [Coemansia sp. RSA 552]
MALVYEPGDALVFRQPFKALTNSSLQLTNKNNSPVAFKVKTTAPKQYCVRPNSGRIEPGDAVQIQISLQPMKEELPADFKCRDKFLIQSIQISPEMESMPMTELWSMVEREAKASISEKKLRVRYLPSEATQPPLPPSQETEAADGKATSPPVQPSAQQLAQPQRVSPGSRTLPGPSPLAKSVDSYNESAEEDAAEPSFYGDAKSPPPKPAVQPKAAASNRLFPESSAAASPESTAEEEPRAAAAESQILRADLDKANATIQELRRQLGEYRAQVERIGAQVERIGSSKAMAPRAVAQSSIDGLSMQSVAIVALVAFLVGYFFF